MLAYFIADEFFSLFSISLDRGVGSALWASKFIAGRYKKIFKHNPQFNLCMINILRFIFYFMYIKWALNVKETDKITWAVIIKLKHFRTVFTAHHQLNVHYKIINLYSITGSTIPDK